MTREEKKQECIKILKREIEDIKKLNYGSIKELQQNDIPDVILDITYETLLENEKRRHTEYDMATSIIINIIKGVDD